ncbi:hypothetical protein DIJ64_07170 [Mycobacterium leprae]|uniref:B2126_C1_169 n=1 Tax=Mycobacterium leprae TaxID=1769 RepID=Q49778_MYCLR|nr:hypothetical protein [Mycobacterium leprae]AAA17186.1 B2126_C1_169 [Mycobacterium leprae]AWV47930.1 hypothetical protein DIJ64_07170 [Mycobacterium leprae]OAR20073.1 hypothetical protein A8144_12340 [Mycobacterium leprae 3125609]OAX70418.1 hypothetical protein A3216_12010 [Mycobacterium leprae 7935681]
MSSAILYLYARLFLLWMCKEEVVAELDDSFYADYLDLNCKYPDVQMFFSVLPNIFVAARPSAKTAVIAPVILKGPFHFTGGAPALDGAKSTFKHDDEWTDEWAHGRSLDALTLQPRHRLQFNIRISDLECEDSRIAALISTDSRRLACDYSLPALSDAA